MSRKPIYIEFTNKHTQKKTMVQISLVLTVEDISPNSLIKVKDQGAFTSVENYEFICKQLEDQES